MAPAIPDRWLNYTPVGKQIDGTRFIAFKVPLRELVNKDVEVKNRLDGNTLMETIPNLGMIIDLTNTKRYYNPEIFMKKGIVYHKLMIPGHHTPPPHLVKQFKNMVTSFLSKNPENDKLIGVHCTHGVNRTGYLICNYMISELNMKPEEAIANFSIARGHKIERENYIESLNNLRNAYKRDRNSRPIKRKYTTVFPTTDFVAPTYNNEPLSWRAPAGPTIAPPPDVFETRNPFKRFRNNANMQRQRYAHIDPSAPTSAPQFANNGYNREMATNSSNYNSRYVNTTNNHSRGGGNPFPYHHDNHHNQLTHASAAYGAQAHESRPYQNNMYRGKNRFHNNDGNSGERNFNRFKLNRRI